MVGKVKKLFFSVSLVVLAVGCKACNDETAPPKGKSKMAVTAKGEQSVVSPSPKGKSKMAVTAKGEQSVVSPSPKAKYKMATIAFVVPYDERDKTGYDQYFDQQADPDALGKQTLNEVGFSGVALFPVNERNTYYIEKKKAENPSSNGVLDKEDQIRPTDFRYNGKSVAALKASGIATITIYEIPVSIDTTPSTQERRQSDTRYDYETMYYVTCMDKKSDFTNPLLDSWALGPSRGDSEPSDSSDKGLHGLELGWPDEPSLKFWTVIRRSALQRSLLITPFRYTADDPPSTLPPSSNTS